MAIRPNTTEKHREPTIWSLENQDKIPDEIIHKVSDELDKLIPALKSFYNVCYDCNFDPELAEDTLKGAKRLALNDVLTDKLLDIVKEALTGGK